MGYRWDSCLIEGGYEQMVPRVKFSEEWKGQNNAFI